MSNTIIISYQAEGSEAYLEGVSELVIGSMVNPETGAFEYQPPAENPWTWQNDGSNNVAFGLMANYKYNGTETTALSKVVIDPTKLSGTDDVNVILYTAAVDGDEGNTLLRFKSVIVNGEEDPEAAFINEWGTEKPQPSSEFYG